MRFRWYEYAIYPLTFIGLALALAFVGVGVTVASIIIAMTHPLRSVKNFLISLTVIALTGATVSWHYYTAQIDLAGRNVSVTVTQNMSFAQLTDSLTNSGAIDKPAFFKICARIRGIDKRLWVGRYDFPAAVSIRSILNKLEAGDVAMVSVTIPEGLRVEQTAGILARSLGFDSSRIVREAFDTLFCRERYQLPNLAGYLAPETYRFPVGAPLIDVFDKLVGDTRRVVAAALAGLDSASRASLTESEIVTLASIIEAEARKPDEQKLISAVYHNRLQKGMLLQADPTVRYGLRLYSRKLYFKDLDRDTPYNTYRRAGLPPGPINSPGQSAIIAAANPADSPYLYFVADGSGGHVFSKTLREHNQAKRRIKSMRH